MKVNENKREQSESEEDEPQARMMYKTALQHVDGLLQYLGNKTTTCSWQKTNIEKNQF